MSNGNGVTKRGRGSSVSQKLHNIETDKQHHLTGAFVPSEPGTPGLKKSPSPSRRPDGIWSDLKTARWMTVPLSSFKILATMILLWANWEIVTPFIAPGVQNPFSYMLFVSYRIPGTPDSDPRYAKGPLDIVFVLYYVVVWSFVRQFLTIHVLKPFARRWGIKKEAKLDRFGEQAYAVIYFSFFGALGFYVMSQLPTWWYKTEFFWLDYPHWQMTPLIKRYYLMQLAYWIQQLIVLSLRLEKPRKDFTELVIHHWVTIWLVGWSYAVNLTLIGNAIFLTMDVSDIFLANAKVLNYLGLEKTSTVAFAIFLPIWSYLRHYLNIKILISVWTQFDLIPNDAKRFVPSEGVWMVWWMKYQIFVPILLLQFVNLFWYFLIWRILYRLLFQNVLADERSDDEDDEEPEVKKAK